MLKLLLEGGYEILLKETWQLMRTAWYKKEYKK